MFATIIISLFLITYVVFVIARLKKHKKQAEKVGCSSACYSCPACKNGQCAGHIKGTWNKYQLGTTVNHKPRKFWKTNIKAYH